MNIHDRNRRRDRAMNLFEAEAREQQLSAIALRQAALGAERAAPTITPGGNPSDPVAGLRAIDRAAEANILDAHRVILTARTHATRMAAVDPELTRLNALIDGTGPAPTKPQPDIIDVEVIEPTKQLAVIPPRLDSA